MKKVLFHLPPNQSDRLIKRPFYQQLREELEANGCWVEIVARASNLRVIELEDDAFHFVHRGSVRKANVLNTGAAYFNRFWYADPRGVWSESSVRNETFAADEVPTKWASGFARRMRKWYVQPRQSRHAQPKSKQSFPEGHVAVFLQGRATSLRWSRYVEELDMVRALQDVVGDREILIKEHPKRTDEDTLRAMKFLARKDHRIKFVDANVHDLLKSSAVCCSTSSGVSMEAILHKCPVMLFGKADFHHVAATVQNSDETEEAFRHALQNEWAFDQYLYWFFRMQMVDAEVRPVLPQVIEKSVFLSDMVAL